MKSQIIELIMEQFNCNRKRAEKYYNSMSYAQRLEYINEIEMEACAWN